MTEPGQPWVSTSGVASARVDRTCRKWMLSPASEPGLPLPGPPPRGQELNWRWEQR
jgi:hypothetical protein